MVININPNRIRTGSGNAGRLADRRPAEDSPAPVTPARAHINHMPEPESLETLIRSAVAALRKGIRWDRGTMLNLLV